MNRIDVWDLKHSLDEYENKWVKSSSRQTYCTVSIHGKRLTFELINCFPNHQTSEKEEWNCYRSVEMLKVRLDWERNSGRLVAFVFFFVDLDGKSHCLCVCLPFNIVAHIFALDWDWTHLNNSTVYIFHTHPQNTIMEAPFHVHRKISYKSKETTSSILFRAKKFHKAILLFLTGKEALKCEKTDKQIMFSYMLSLTFRSYCDTQDTWGVCIIDKFGSIKDNWCSCHKW